MVAPHSSNSRKSCKNQAQSIATRDRSIFCGAMKFLVSSDETSEVTMFLKEADMSPWRMVVRFCEIFENENQDMFIPQAAVEPACSSEVFFGCHDGHGWNSKCSSMQCFLARWDKHPPSVQHSDLFCFILNRLFVMTCFYGVFLFVPPSCTICPWCIFYWYIFL